jgi:hypothetical protein
VVAAVSSPLKSLGLQLHLGDNVEKFVGVVWFLRLLWLRGSPPRSFIEGYSFFFFPRTDVAF